MFEEFYNIHKGQTALVIGNGPSLRDVPTSLFDHYPTFGSNRIYLKCIPDYYVAVNQLVIDQFKKDIMGLPCTKFIREGNDMHDRSHTYYLHLVETPMFSFSPTVWLYDGHNTTFVLLQLAFFMGFSKVKLIGVDHKYKYQGEPNEVLTMKGDDPNHFNNHYFENGTKWQAPDLEVSEQAYQMAKEAYEQNGRSIVNVTPNSALEVFDFEEEPWVA